MRLLLVSQLDFFWQTERQRTRSSQFLLKLKEIRCLLLHKGSSGVGMLHEKMDDREDSSTPSTTTEVLSESAHLQSLDVATPPGELANNELLPYGSANAFCDTDCKIPKN